MGFASTHMALYSAAIESESFSGWETSTTANALITCNVNGGKPLGISLAMGMLAYWDQRLRSDSMYPALSVLPPCISLPLSFLSEAEGRGGR
jgi:hypothetical protein